MAEPRRFRDPSRLGDLVDKESPPEIEVVVFKVAERVGVKPFPAFERVVFEVAGDGVVEAVKEAESLELPSPVRPAGILERVESCESLEVGGEEALEVLEAFELG